MRRKPWKRVSVNEKRREKQLKKKLNQNWLQKFKSYQSLKTLDLLSMAILKLENIASKRQVFVDISRHYVLYTKFPNFSIFFQGAACLFLSSRYIMGKCIWHSKCWVHKEKLHLEKFVCKTYGQLHWSVRKKYLYFYVQISGRVVHQKPAIWKRYCQFEDRNRK